ncbi:hypothetical protein H632_c73p2 [Helicosporidium sp. ATCC 50920]|nr:hypothetical protein H632_c73p2 [Helicosporidium sp. ATCC 50920]|eukprot:KDD76897.1 hypothetical protein H632_c73p2 [Helicosporidium sp. ATCC 50920]
MHVKTGDLVKVMAGTGKGTVGKILKVFTKLGRVLMRDVNVKVKNIKPRSPEEKGRQIRVEFPIHHSNVAHYSTAHETHSRVGHRVQEDGAKVRYLIKTGEVLET